MLNAAVNAALATTGIASFALTNNASAQHQHLVGSINGVHVTFEARCHTAKFERHTARPHGARCLPRGGAIFSTALGVRHRSCQAVGKMLGPALGAPLLGSLLATFHSAGQADPLVNGGCATLSVFGAGSFLCFLGSMALPRVVDGLQRSSLLPRRALRSSSTSSE